MAVPIEEVNDAITFEQSTFSKIDESKTLKVSCRFHQYHAWTARINTRAVRTVTDRHTDYCNPAAHAQRVNYTNSYRSTLGHLVCCHKIVMVYIIIYFSTK